MPLSITPIFGLLLSWLLVSCAGIKPESPQTNTAPVKDREVASPGASALPGAGTLGAPVVPPVTPPLSAQNGADAPAPAAQASAAKPPAPAVPPASEQAPKKTPAKVAAGTPKGPPPLDLKALETRLRETEAIGTFTKITLKNQVNDLLDQFRTYHKGQRKGTLAELRQTYNLLMLKVLALLQDSDPLLAREIASSREAIWGVLVDPVKFSRI